ncbi:MAG: hypothetical protein LBV51_00915 [Acholeplasmatales bacterium]|jgi:hypothetical protein|nr:hypothetical protein [Acholeplasmatales bacterium]
MDEKEYKQLLQTLEILEKDNKKSEAFDVLVKLNSYPLKTGDVIFKLAYKYYKPYEGAPQSYSKAYELFMEASKKDNPDALYYLYLMYYSGNYAKQDKEKAIQYFIEALRLGQKQALKTLEEVSKTLKKEPSVTEIQNNQNEIKVLSESNNKLNETNKSLKLDIKNKDKEIMALKSQNDKLKKEYLIQGNSDVGELLKYNGNFYKEILYKNIQAKHTIFSHLVNKTLDDTKSIVESLNRQKTGFEKIICTFYYYYDQSKLNHNDALDMEFSFLLTPLNKAIEILFGSFFKAIFHKRKYKIPPNVSIKTKKALTIETFIEKTTVREKIIVLNNWIKFDNDSIFINNTKSLIGDFVNKINNWYTKRNEVTHSISIIDFETTNKYIDQAIIILCEIVDLAIFFKLDKWWEENN